MVLAIVTIHGVDKCKALINKMNKLTDFVKTLDSFPLIYVNGEDMPPYDLSLMTAAEKLFVPIYDDIISICEKEYGVDVDK